MDTTAKNSPRIFVFSHPRTASNVFMKMLGNHPQLEILPYAFHNAWTLGPEKLERRSRPEYVGPESWKEAAAEETYQKAFDRVQSNILEAEERGKIAMFKEHVYLILDPKVVVENLSSEAGAKRVVLDRPTIIDHHSSEPILADTTIQSTTNGQLSAPLSYSQSKPTPIPPNPTVLPTSFLRTMSPVCLIRHPAPTFESYYRAAIQGNLNISIHDEDFPVNTSLRWVRLVHDWYLSLGKQPLVIEADDLINEDTVMPKFCKALSLDPQYLRTKWDKVPEEKKTGQGAMGAAFLKTMQNSTGIIKSRRRDFEIHNAQERERWAVDLGEEVADALYRAAEDAMPDYMYLRGLRLV